MEMRAIYVRVWHEMNRSLPHVTYLRASGVNHNRARDVMDFCAARAMRALRSTKDEE